MGGGGQVIDATISLGNLLTIASILVTLFVLHGQNRARFERMETKVDALWQWFLRTRPWRDHDDKDDRA